MATHARVFKDRWKLKTMLSLRRLGWSYQALGFIFGVDYSSIYHVCKVRGVPRPKESVSLDVSSILSAFQTPEKRNKSYREYLEEDKHRKFPKLHALMNGYNES